MLDLLIESLSEIKSYVVLLSFYIKIIKQRTFQACSLKNSIKKGMFYVQGKFNFFKSGRGGVLPPFLPGYAPVCLKSPWKLKRFALLKSPVFCWYTEKLKAKMLIFLGMICSIWYIFGVLLSYLFLQFFLVAQVITANYGFLVSFARDIFLRDSIFILSFASTTVSNDFINLFSFLHFNEVLVP